MAEIINTKTFNWASSAASAPVQLLMKEGLYCIELDHQPSWQGNFCGSARPRGTEERRMDGKSKNQSMIGPELLMTDIVTSQASDRLRGQKVAWNLP